MSAPVQPGDVLAGKYRVDRVLGVGGMGVVVQCTHTQLDERVALKFMLPEAMANADIANRFVREARLAVKLKSEHVAKVMDVGTLENGAPYIVMEYLDGTDLNQLLEKHGPLPYADVAEYVIQACDAIAEAHVLGIVHRDLKPANLFVVRRPDGAPLTKVLDFGISKASPLGDASGGMTKTSTMMGSPYFMSPEQMRSAKDVDARSDVWSMGVVLYQLLTARLPFESDTLGGIMAQVLQDDPSSLSQYRPDVPHAFQSIVSRCLTRDRTGRAQNVGEIAVTLAPYAPTRVRPIADRIVALLGSHAGKSTLVMGGMGAATAEASAPVIGGLPTAARVAAPVTSPPVLGAAPLTSTDPGNVIKKDSLGPVIAVIALVAAVGGGAFWWYRSNQTATKDAVAAAKTTASAEASATSTAAVLAVAIPVPSAVAPAASASAAPVVAPAVAVAPPPIRQASGVPVSRAPVARPLPAPVAAPPPPPGPKRSVLDERN